MYCLTERKQEANIFGGGKTKVLILFNVFWKNGYGISLDL
jgi:hypothetical protein